MLELGLFLITCCIIGGIVMLIEWNGKREKRKREQTESVKRSAVLVSAPVSANQASRYVQPPPPDTDTASIPPVSDTGIGVDMARLAGNLTEAQRLEILALARTPKGKWAYSGKKLYTLFGGNYNDFVATMRKLRDGQDDDPPEEPTILTPIAGRPTKASYYPDDPALEFQPPPGGRG